MKCLLLLLLIAGCAGAPPRDETLRFVVAAEADAPSEAVSLAQRRLGSRVVTLEGQRAVATDVRAALDEALAANARFDHAAALARLADAQRDLEANGTSEADFAFLHEVLVARALFESDRGGDPALVDAALRRAATLDPERALDSSRIPPDLAERYAAIVSAVREQPPTSATITTDPPGAVAYLDGREVGRTPLTLRAAAGTHYVRLALLGYAATLLTIELGGGAPLAVRLEPSSEAALAAIARSTRAELERLPPARRNQLSRELRADTIVTLDDGVQARAFDLRAARLDERQIPWPLGRDELERWLDARRPRAEERDDDTIFESPWFWVGVGVVVAAGTTTAILLTEDLDPVLRLSQ